MNNLKEISIKNRTCYYFDDIIKIEKFDFDKFLLNKKSNKNILFYGILYKTLTGAKLLCISFDKIDGFIRIYGGNKYLVLYGPEKYDAIYDRMRLYVKKSGITYVFSPKYEIIKIDSYDYLPLEKYWLCIML